MSRCDLKKFEEKRPMPLMTTHRPRDVDATRAAGILYGDWGTSKAYVVGLAIAIAGYASFWPILAVSVLSLFVGLNYMMVCKYYPNGGGVYASARSRSKILAMVGAFFLTADYLVTAALSALAAFHYFGVGHPVLFSAAFICLVGLFNYFGPRYTGSFALFIAIAAVAIFTLLALFCLPFLRQGWNHLEPIAKNPLTFWTQFCSVVLALSGIETIANTTSVMKLNRGSSNRHPLVTRTSTPAILWVMLEVVVYTTLFALAAMAISNFHIGNQSVSLLGFPEADNRMLSVLAFVFGSDLLGSDFGLFFSRLIGIVVAFILFSAVNTAINGLIALQYFMASDGELPSSFRKINRFGVPLLPLLIATVVPAILILIFKKIILLADLYAIGFVGAITVNLGATSTNKKLPIRFQARIFMFFTAAIMALIEITLFIQKPDARYFVLTILIVGLGLRLLAKKLIKEEILAPAVETIQEEKKGVPLCIIKKFGKAVRHAIAQSSKQHEELNIVFVREQRFITERDLKKKGTKDKDFKNLLFYIRKYGQPNLINFYYCVTDSFVDIAVAYTERLDAEQIMVDSVHSKLEKIIKGNDVIALKKQLANTVKVIDI